MQHRTGSMRLSYALRSFPIEVEQSLGAISLPGATPAALARSDGRTERAKMMDTCANNSIRLSVCVFVVTLNLRRERPAGSEQVCSLIDLAAQINGAHRSKRRRPLKQVFVGRDCVSGGAPVLLATAARRSLIELSSERASERVLH